MDKKVYFYVTPFFPSPKQWRGAYCYDFVVALQRQFRSKNVECRVVVMTEGDGSDYEIGGVQVHTFKAKRLPSNIFPNLFARYNQRSFLAKVKEVLTPLFDFDSELQLFSTVEVCHAHTANYGIYALAMKKANSKCKTLLHHHDLASFGLNMGMLRYNWLYNMIQFPILRRMHEKIDTHVFISEASKKSFLSAPDASWTIYEDYKKQMRWLPYCPVRIKDSIILHNGVDKSIFCPSTSHASSSSVALTKEDQTSRTSQTFTIGCVGNFTDLKDQETLIRAVDLIDQPIHVVFVGSGRLLEKCKALAKEQEEKFRSTPTPKTYTFKSEVQHSDLADFYRSLDIFVLPSYFEGFGCVFTEAHSCGVPFITCIGQGIDDIISVEDRNKWLCKPKDAEDLANKIADAIELKIKVEFAEWRTIQVLNEDQDIDSLVGDFIRKL